MSREPLLIYKNTFTAFSIQQILDIVISIKIKLNKKLWFRGQGPYYNLRPSLLRESKVIQDPRGNKTTIEGNASGHIHAFPNQFKMAQEFSKISDHLFKTHPKNTLEWLCIMQHYGVPTKLLDWTMDPMIALFFATEELNKENHNTLKVSANEKGKEYAAELWIIAPELVNLYSQFNKECVFDTTSNQAKVFIKGDGGYVPNSYQRSNDRREVNSSKRMFYCSWI